MKCHICRTINLLSNPYMLHVFRGVISNANVARLQIYSGSYDITYEHTLFYNALFTSSSPSCSNIDFFMSLTWKVQAALPHRPEFSGRTGVEECLNFFLADGVSRPKRMGSKPLSHRPAVGPDSFIVPGLQNTRDQLPSPGLPAHSKLVDIMQYYIQPLQAITHQGGKLWSIVYK